MPKKKTLRSAHAASVSRLLGEAFTRSFRRSPNALDRGPTGYSRGFMVSNNGGDSDQPHWSVVTWHSGDYVRRPDHASQERRYLKAYQQHLSAAYDVRFVDTDYAWLVVQQLGAGDKVCGRCGSEIDDTEHGTCFACKESDVLSGGPFGPLAGPMFGSGGNDAS